MPTNAKPKRTQLSVSLPPDLFDRLARESNDRLLAPSVLVEKAIVGLFAEMDRPDDPTQKQAATSTP